MLFSPAAIHDNLSSVTSSTDTSLPHTALLITPAGQIMSWVSTPPGYDYYDGDGAGSQEHDQNGDANYDEGVIDEEEGDEGDDEPWLDTPERLRLILGLVAEFTEGIVNKIESEVCNLCLSLPDAVRAPTD
jgi:hypothetical protein